MVEVLIVAIIVCILAAIAAPVFLGINFAPGEGEKVGQIVKLAKTGMIRQTWEAEIVRGGFQGGGGVNGQAFDFTVEGDTLAARLRALMEKQAEVRITYRTEGIYSPLRSASAGHFLVSIDTVAKK